MITSGKSLEITYIADGMIYFFHREQQENMLGGFCILLITKIMKIDVGWWQSFIDVRKRNE